MKIINNILIDIDEEDIIDKTVNIPKQVRIIGKHSFKDCRFIEKIIIPGNVKIIEEEAFYNCINLKDIIILEGVQIIGNEAFDWCQSIENITLPNSLTTIGINPFSEKTNLKNIKTPWGEIEFEKGTFNSSEIISIYLYLYADSILKDKYNNITDFLSNQSIKNLMDEDKNIFGNNGLQKFKTLFYKMRKTFDIDDDLFISLDLKTTKKFNLNTWNRIKNVFDWKTSYDMSKAMAEMIIQFGIFENDSNKENRIQTFINLFTKENYLITEQEYNQLLLSISNKKKVTEISNSFKKIKVKKIVLKDDIVIPPQFNIYLKEELTDEMVKKIKKLDGSYGKQINEFLKKNYKSINIENYKLKEEYLTDEQIDLLLFNTDILGHINYSSLHRMFDGCKKEFNEDFYNFLIDNFIYILHDEKLQSNIKNIQKNFETIKHHYMYTSGIKEITLKQAIDFLDSKIFNYRDGNYELSQEVKKAGVSSQEAFEYYQKVYEQNNNRKLTALIKRSNIYEIDGYKIKAELLRKDDSLAMLVGEINYTNCCQVYGGIGHNSMAHATSSNEGGIFVTKLLKDGEEILLTQSWDWQNNNVYCHDNIEVTCYLKTDSKLKKVVAKVYELDGNYIIEKSKEEIENYIKTRKKIIERSISPNKEQELQELRQLEERQIIKVVTIGLANDELGISKFFKKSIDVNKIQIINGKEYKLQHFQPINYDYNQPYFNQNKSDYTDSYVTQYIIAGSIEELCLEKLEPLVPIYRDKRRIYLEKGEEIRNYTTKKIKDIEKVSYPKNMLNYQDSSKMNFYDSNVYLGEDWYLIYEEKEDNTIYISDLAKIKPNIKDESSIQNQEIMNIFYNLVRTYDKVELDLKEDTSYLLFLINKKLGYLEQIGDDISYRYNNPHKQKIITEEQQQKILNNYKNIRNSKKSSQIMHKIVLKKGKLLSTNKSKIKKMNCI